MAKKSPTMKFEWIDGATGVVERLGFGEHLNEFFAETLLMTAEPYTPEDTGAMIQSARIQSSPRNAKIVYDVKYADYQYNNSNYNHPKPLATDHWLEYAWQVHKYEIAGKVGAEVRWRGR